jgi:hypothetical protein
VSDRRLGGGAPLGELTGADLAEVRRLIRLMIDE